MVFGQFPTPDQTVHAPLSPDHLRQSKLSWGHCVALQFGLGLGLWRWHCAALGFDLGLGSGLGLGLCLGLGSGSVRHLGLGMGMGLGLGSGPGQPKTRQNGGPVANTQACRMPTLAHFGPRGSILRRSEQQSGQPLQPVRDFGATICAFGGTCYTALGPIMATLQMLRFGLPACHCCLFMLVACRLLLNMRAHPRPSQVMPRIRLKQLSDLLRPPPYPCITS